MYQFFNIVRTQTASCEDDYGNILACAIPLNITSCSTVLQNGCSDDPNNGPVQFKIEADGLPLGKSLKPFKNCVGFQSDIPSVVIPDNSTPCVTVP